MRVQRVAAVGGLEESWTLLGDDWIPVGPVDQFLSHLTDQRRSPNTVKAYAYDLQDFFGYLGHRGLAWDRLRYDELAGFKPWLRLPRSARLGALSVLPSVTSACAESTINRKLAAITAFYDFHARHGVELALTIRSAGRPVRSSRSSFRPFLSHIKRSRPQSGDLRVKEPQRHARTLSDSQIESLIAATTRRRDDVLLRLLNEGGLRIGEALGLRHEDVRTADATIEVRQPRTPTGRGPRRGSGRSPSVLGGCAGMPITCITSTAIWTATTCSSGSGRIPAAAR